MKHALSLMLIAAWVCADVAIATAHDGTIHPTPTPTPAVTAVAAEPAEHPKQTLPPGAADPFPLDLTAKFDLIDHTGRRRTEKDFRGKPMAIFFGYANCTSICPTALSRLGAAVDLLGNESAELQMLLITVDPARDTPDTMSRMLPEFHPRMIGLTGSESELAAARASFQVESKQVSRDTDGKPIYAHGSFIYVMNSQGQLQSLLPPILTPERMAEIIRNYL